MAPQEETVIDVKLAFIRESLEELSKGQTSQLEHIIQLREEIAGLKVKSGIWGAIAGAIPSAIAVIYMFFGKH